MARDVEASDDLLAGTVPHVPPGQAACEQRVECGAVVRDLEVTVSDWQIVEGYALAENIVAKTWCASRTYAEWFSSGWVRTRPYPAWWLWVDYLAFAIAQPSAILRPAATSAADASEARPHAS